VTYFLRRHDEGAVQPEDSMHSFIGEVSLVAGANQG
jgi:hypothetical protein